MPVRTCCIALLSLLSVAPAAQAGPFDTEYGPGFSARVGGKALVECSVRKGRLQCRNYAGSPPAGASCSFGGVVATVTVGRTGAARRSYVCMDEGFHGWKTLRRGRSFRSGPFRCTHRHRLLSCRNADHRFRIDERGRVTRERTGGA